MGRYWKLTEDAELNLVAALDLGSLEKQNMLRADVLKELNVILSTERPKALILTTAKPHSFCAGADINEIKGMADGDPAVMKAALESMHEVLMKVHNAPFPVVAAISGECLGGGMELSMACHKRIAARHPKTRFGLPEVGLGVIPGFGGTQFLPRLVGVKKALEVIVGQRKLSADEALKCGLIDKVVEPDQLIEEAKKLAFRRTEHKMPWAERIPCARRFILKMAGKQALKATKGVYPAPLKAIESIRNSMNGLKNGLDKEAKLFMECAASMESQSLIDIFLTQQKARSNDWVGMRTTPPERVMVLGAGVMGRTIAYAVLMGGVKVTLHDIYPKAVYDSVMFIESMLVKGCKKGKLSPADAQKMRDNLKTSSGEEPLVDGVDFVIEVILENTEVKQKVLAALEKRLPENTVIVTNTSSLLPSEIATPLLRKDKFCAMHFFNPAHMMDLVEIVGTAETSDETLAKTLALTKAMKKTPVVLDKECAGLLVNRVLVRGMAWALYEFVHNGIDPWKLDKALERYGMVMGPFKTIDLVGFDIAHHVMQMMAHYYPDIYKNMLELNLEIHKYKDLLGQKTGKGFYLWEGTKAVGPNPEILQKFGWKVDPDSWAETGAAILNVVRLMEREAKTLADENICNSTDMIDLAMVLGAGITPNRRGLLKNPLKLK